MQSDNMRSALARVKAASSTSKLKALIDSFTNIYNSGHLTASELRQLDDKIMVKLARTPIETT